MQVEKRLMMTCITERKRKVAAKLKDLIKNIDDANAAAAGNVLAIQHIERDNSLKLQIAFEQRVPFTSLLETASFIKNELGCESVSIYPKYSPELFDRDAVLDITDLLRSEPLPGCEQEQQCPLSGS